MVDPAEARYVRPWGPLVLPLIGGSGRALVAALRPGPSPEVFKLNLKKGQIRKVEAIAWTDPGGLTLVNP